MRNKDEVNETKDSSFKGTEKQRTTIEALFGTLKPVLKTKES